MHNDSKGFDYNRVDHTKPMQCTDICMLELACKHFYLEPAYNRVSCNEPYHMTSLNDLGTAAAYIAKSPYKYTMIHT